MQSAFAKNNETLTSHNASDCIECMKWLALLLLGVLECSCTTLVNRRDLYSPDPAPDSLEAARQWYGITTTSTTTKTTTTTAPGEEALPPPALPH